MTRLTSSAIVSALILTVALLSLAGCGGSDSTAASSGPSESGSITKAELIKQGDAICRKTDTIQKNAVKAYEDKHGEVTLISKVEKMLKAVALPPIRTEIEELSALGAPKGEEAEVKAIITGLERALKATEEKTFTLVNGDDGEFIKPDQLAKKYGFKDCAKAL